MEELTEKLDEYLAEHVTDAITEAEDSISELKRLMILAVTELGGIEARDALLRKIAALSRANALSTASGSDWSGEAPDQSAQNRASISGHSNEDVEHEKETALRVFDQVTKDLNEERREHLKEFRGDVEFNGDVRALHEILTTTKEMLFGQTGPMAGYCAAITRTVRK
jgi:hypothetical protein